MLSLFSAEEGTLEREPQSGWCESVTTLSLVKELASQKCYPLRILRRFPPS